MMCFPAMFKQLLPAILLMVVLADVFGQSPGAWLQKGDRFYQRKDYASALRHYREALTLEEDNARTNFKAGVSCLNEKYYSEALNYLERAYELEPTVDPQIDYHLATAYQENHQFARALKHYKVFRSTYKNLAGLANQKIAECVLADSLMNIRPDVTVGPVEGLNTAFAEFSPVISPDGRKLIFTSNRSEDAYQIKSGTNYGEVYVSERSPKQWGPPTKIAPSINVRLHEAALAISADGKTLLLYYEDGGGDIYASALDEGEWSVPVALNRFVNHPQYRESSACLSPDGRKIFFASNRPGGKGGYDLYVCELGDNGQWGRPSNLGSPVNTRGDEEFPFLHADGKTLYFSSNGHPTLGEHDIFKSTLQESGWSSPAHLGYPVNTRGYEGGLVLTANGATGYFFSKRGSPPDNADLYQVNFRAHQRTDTTAVESDGQRSGEEKEIVTRLKGMVIDVEENVPLEATVRLVDNEENSIIATVKTGPSGVFEVIIPRAGNFGLMTSRSGYLFNSMNFILPPFGKYQEIDTHILMARARVGSKVVLKNIFFDLNQSELRPESLSELQNIRDLLLENPQWRIQINGHTDNTGHPKINMDLSLKRAQSVVQYLIREGIAPDRLHAKGFGSEKPLVSNDDENEGRQINRRTEIEIIE